MMTTLTTEEIFVATAIKSWDAWIGRAGKVFDSLSDDAMLIEIAPGKNRPIYLLGHLIAVHDASKGGTLYVATSGSPYPIELVNGADQAKVTFSQFNAHVPLAAPPGAVSTNAIGK